jgi:nucleoside-diphosphate-sugar epimerase
MKVLVTGAAGGLGSVTAREFLEQGHEVRVLDRVSVAPDLRERCEVVYAEITDRLAVLQAVQGCDAVAHLAAIPNPNHGKDTDMFAPNVMGTQLLMAAAEGEGIKRFALASSISINGFPFQVDREGPKAIGPQYLPLDENHPLLYQDVYALSKHCNEMTAAMYTRRCDMATTCMRITMAVDLERIAPWNRRFLEHSSRHRNQDLWSYVDRRDVARAFRMAIERVESGHHVALIAARDAWGFDAPGDTSVTDRIRRNYPELVSFLDNGFDYERFGFVDTRRAEETFGWVAQYLWRDVPELREASEEFAKSS